MRAGAEWIWLATGYTLIAAGLCLAAWLLVRRFKHVAAPHCRRCRYSMVGLSSLQCPECGDRHALPAELRSSPRLRVLVAAALLLGVGFALTSIPAIRRHGPYAAVPTTLLVMMLPSRGSESTGHGEHPAAAEFGRRVEGNSVANWQMQWALNRFGVLRVQFYSPQTRHLQVDATLPSWCSHYDLSFRADAPDAVHLRVKARGIAECGLSAMERRSRESQLPAGRVPEGEPEIAFRYTLDRAPIWTRPKSTCTKQFTGTLTLQLPTAAKR